MQGMQERRWEVCGVCVCVLISTPLCIYSREPRGETAATDFSNQWRGDTWRSWGGVAHGPGRPTCRSVDLPGGPIDPSFVQQAVLGLLVWSTVVLACLNWVLASLLVHLNLNRCSYNFCDFMSGQIVLVTCILAWKHNLHILKNKVWFRDFIG